MIKTLATALLLTLNASMAMAFSPTIDLPKSWLAPVAEDTAPPFDEHCLDDVQAAETTMNILGQDRKVIIITSPKYVLFMIKRGSVE